MNQNLLTSANSLYINHLKELNREILENLNLDVNHMNHTNHENEPFPNGEVFDLLKEFLGKYKFENIF